MKAREVEASHSENFTVGMWKSKDDNEAKPMAFLNLEIRLLCKDDKRSNEARNEWANEQIDFAAESNELLFKMLD